MDIEVYVERMATITIVSNVAGTETGWLICHLVYCLLVPHLSLNECCKNALENAMKISRKIIVVYSALLSLSLSDAAKKHR